MNSRAVVQNWANDRPGGNGNGALITDGRRLLHYDLVIGVTDADGRKAALNVLAPYNVSATTSKHASAARGVAHYSVDPVAGKRNGRLSEIWVFPAEYLNDDSPSPSLADVRASRMDVLADASAPHIPAPAAYTPHTASYREELELSAAIEGLNADQAVTLLQAETLHESEYPDGLQTWVNWTLIQAGDHSTFSRALAIAKFVKSGGSLR